VPGEGLKLRPVNDLAGLIEFCGGVSEKPRMGMVK
jgi:hypothetical protein